MSRIKEQSKLLQVKILLEHYKYICYLNDLSKEEFLALIFNSDPALYAAFKNHQLKVEDVRNIVSVYQKVIKATIKKIENFLYSEEYKKNISKYRPIYISYRILRLKHFNKTNHSNNYIANELNISDVNHFCRKYQEALKLFAYYLTDVANKNGYKNVFDNIRIIELMRLDKEAKKKRITKIIA